jgi:hypothetical protein
MEEGMLCKYLACAFLGTLLAGCGANANAPDGRDVAKYGYLYHDAAHPGGSSQASPEAIYNATHGTWLWPPGDVNDHKPPH